jgi:hypothetical protein
MVGVLPVDLRRAEHRRRHQSQRGRTMNCKASGGRPFLYILVFLAVLNSCDASNEARRTADNLKRISDLIEAPKP